MGQDYQTSNWIWLEGWDKRKREEPCIVYFRKRFRKADRIRISANCRYKLYINGQFVQEGPQKGTREAAYVDDAQIASFCRPGENIAATEVLYYPEDSGKRNDSLYYSPFPCLYIEDPGEYRELDGREGWKCHLAEEICLVREPFDPAPIHGSEIVHNQETTRGWKEAGYDDSGWEDARPYTFFEVTKPVAPFTLEPRTIPPMEHHRGSFAEVVCVRESCARKKEELKEEWERLLSGKAPVEIPANTTYIVELSAGEEMCGYPSLALAGGRGSSVELLYSEAYGVPQPDMETPFGTRPVPPKKGDRTDFVSGCLQGTTDIYEAAGYGTKEDPEVYTPFLFRTFRYIQVKIRTADEGMSVLRYDYLSTGYPLQIRTKLRTSDESLNKIWDISVRTLQRCMHETYVDCPFYEQMQYTMDSRAEMLFTYSLGMDDRLARQCMDSFRKTQRSDGILQASAPAQGVNVIPGFSIFYILMVHDYMMYFGDPSLVREHFGCVDRILEYFHSHLTGKGLVGKTGGVLFQHKYWSFIDWCKEWDNTIGSHPWRRFDHNGESSLSVRSAESV